MENYYPKDLKHREEFFELDKLVMEANRIISKIVSDIVLTECNNEGREPIANDIVAEYNSGMIMFIEKFIKESKKAQQWYLDESARMYKRNKEMK